MSKKLHIIEAEFCVNTPLFLGGADPRRTVELRTASIKGAIRFWWRALAYGRSGGDIDRMRQEEGRIFGSTTRQAQVHISMPKAAIGSKHNAGTNPQFFSNQSGSIYLGYGVIDVNGQLSRPCLTGSRFTLRLLSRKRIEDSVIQAVQLLGLIGNLGSKSRKGYGSLTLLEMKQTESPGDSETETTALLPFSAPSNKEGYAEQLSALLHPALRYEDLPEISAFSSHARADSLLSGPDPLAILDGYGRMMQRYRSWGFQMGNGPHKVNGQNAEQNFPDDHDWFKDLDGWRRKHPGFYPQRVEFGLPHNYFSRQPRTSAEVEPGGELTRRASPLFFHIHRLKDKTFIGVALVIKSRFLPRNTRISADGTNVVVSSAIESYQQIIGFLEGCKKGREDNKTQTPYFPQRNPLWPPKENAS